MADYVPRDCLILSDDATGTEVDSMVADLARQIEEHGCTTSYRYKHIHVVIVIVRYNKNLLRNHGHAAHVIMIMQIDRDIQSRITSAMNEMMNE